MLHTLVNTRIITEIFFALGLLVTINQFLLERIKYKWNINHLVEYIRGVYLLYSIVKSPEKVGFDSDVSSVIVDNYANAIFFSEEDMFTENI